MGSCDRWEFLQFFRGHCTSSCTALTAGRRMPAVRADCTKVYTTLASSKPSCQPHSLLPTTCSTYTLFIIPPSCHDVLSSLSQPWVQRIKHSFLLAYDDILNLYPVLIFIHHSRNGIKVTVGAAWLVHVLIWVRIRMLGLPLTMFAVFICYIWKCCNGGLLSSKEQNNDYVYILVNEEIFVTDEWQSLNTPTIRQ